LKLWYSQQAAEGNAPGHLLGQWLSGIWAYQNGGEGRKGGDERNDAAANDSDGEDN
jgi:hypothetical protein